MNNTSSRIPASFSSYRKPNTVLQMVQQKSDKDGEKLSPVDLAISAANTIQLPPLAWTHYQLTPTNMTVRNSGFTVMINASYDQEPPYVSSGPLMGKYVFSQIHFHWGEHDDTGSGHAVDGIRYPLEMHVVHLRKDCANLGEAFKKKDGIAVMVHLFALREERNTKLDQLTAILQFIQKPKCCARLYPIPLSEIVHPFSTDYFLYWGAVGSPKGQYRILWLVSRNVLPVSTHQLGEFRQLRDPQGKILGTNSSKPQPLAGRSLFLVSPSDRTKETMYGISRRPTKSVVDSESDESLDIGNAEYKSLAALDEDGNDSCRVCHGPQRLKHIANINVGYPLKINEGDTSVEESCIDLGEMGDSGVTVKTETKYKEDLRGQKVITNVNVTACRPKTRPKYNPPEAVYSVVSTRGSELHLKRKPLVVRLNDPSTEQACMMLSNRSAVRLTSSSPSLTGGLLTIKQEHTELSNPPMTNLSSELAVFNRDSESDQLVEKDSRILTHGLLKTYHSYTKQLEQETLFEKSLKSSKKAKKVTIYGFENNNIANGPHLNDDPATQIDKNPQARSPKGSAVPRLDTKPENYNEYYEEEEQNISHNKAYQYVQIKKNNDVNYLYKSPTTNEPQALPLGQENPIKNNILASENSQYFQNDVDRHTENKFVNPNNKTIPNTGYDSKPRPQKESMNQAHKEIYQDEFYLKKDHKEKTHRELVFKKSVPFSIPSISNQAERASEEKENVPRSKDDKKLENNKKQHEPQSDTQYKVSLIVRTTVSDHRRPGKKKGIAAKQYVVTKISPIEKSTYITQKSSDPNLQKCYGKNRTSDDIEHLYIARPINEDPNKYPTNNNEQSTKTTQRSNHKRPHYASDYYESLTEDQHKKQTHEKHFTISTYQNENRNPLLQLNPSQNETNYKSLPKNHNRLDQTLNKRDKTDPQYQINSDTEPKEITPVSEKYISGETYEEHLDKGLTKKVNVYHGKNEPDEDVQFVDQTITGKMGQNQSTDVIVKSMHIGVVQPNKTNVSKELNYNLLKSKHPEPQYYVQETPNKTQPNAIIRQSLSLDQQIKGHSQVKHTVEYYDKRTPKIAGNVSSQQPVVEVHQPQEERGSFKDKIEKYEESSHEQSSMLKKSRQHTFRSSQPTMQYTFKDPTDLCPINSVDNKKYTSTIEEEKNTVLKLINSDTNKFIPNIPHDTITEDATRCKKLESQNAFGNSIYPTAGPSNKTLIIKENQDPLVGQQFMNNPGQSNYVYEETSSITKEEHSRHEKKLKYDKHEIPFHRDRELIDPNKPVQNDLPPKHHTKENIENEPPISNNYYLQNPIKGKEIIAKSVCPAPGPNQTGQLIENTDENVEFEEVTEEDEVYTLKKRTEKTRTVQGTDKPVFKFPNKKTDNIIKEDLQHTITIKKDEVAPPRYITRVPKQPLIEYEAYHVDPQQPFEIITETSEEVSSVFKTNKTFMMFKKINGKTVLNQPSVMEPVKIETNTKELPQRSEVTVRNENSFVCTNKHSPIKSNLEVITAPRTNEEVYFEQSNEEEKERFVKIKQIRGHNTSYMNQNQVLEERNVNKIDPSSKTQEENKIESSKQLHQNNSELTSIQTVSSPLTLPNKPEEKYTEYEYSETSLISQQKLLKKEKKYKLRTNHPPVYEEDGKNNQNPQLTGVKNSSEEGNSTETQHFSNNINQKTNEESKNENSSKIIVGSYQPKTSIFNKPQTRSSVQYANPGAENKTPDQALTLMRSPPTEHGLFMDEEYYESIEKDEKHESSRKYFKTFRGIPELQGLSQSDYPNQREPPPQEDSNKYKKNIYPETQDEPTKDLPMGPKKPGQWEYKDEYGNESYEESQKKTHLYKHFSNEEPKPKIKMGTPQLIKNDNNTAPITKDDGDIVIYIRQPKIKREQISPRITVDVTKSNDTSLSEHNEQKVQVHGMEPEQKHVKKAKKPIKPRKSKSANIYRPSFSSESSEDDAVNNISSESNEEQVIDMTHYNLTLKSETQVEVPSGRGTKVKSRAEVKLRPSSRPATPGKSRGGAQDCCSAVKITEIQDNYDSTSLEDSAGSGVNQSPIKIDPKTSILKKYPNLKFVNHWNAQGDALLENNGKTLRGSYIPDTMLPYFQGGPLNGEYIFYELHFHWGHKDCCGAEHIIDGQRYTIEAHFLYYKKEYESLKEGMSHTDGLAIVAVNLNVGGPPNPQFGELIKDMPLIREADTGTYIPAESLFSWIRPAIQAAKGYYSYKGSLTLEPPYVESVTWFIFPEPIVFCCQQSSEFRKLKSTKGELLKKNFRTPQPLNNRTVYYVPL